MRRGLQLLFFWWLVSAVAYAVDPAQPFDLTGPKVDVRVKRGEVTLPIGETPNLLPGDRLWIHPDLPGSQSAHFVLIVAFLRGATNLPSAEFTGTQLSVPHPSNGVLYLKLRDDPATVQALTLPVLSMSSSVAPPAVAPAIPAQPQPTAPHATPPATPEKTET